MTWIEITWLCSLPFLPIFFGFMSWNAEDDFVEGFGLGMILSIVVFFIGAITGVFTTECSEFKIAKKEEALVTSSVITSSGLDIVTSNHEHVYFPNHEDVKKWENGGKLFKVYLEKNIFFGPDAAKTEYKIESAEQ